MSGEALKKSKKIFSPLRNRDGSESRTSVINMQVRGGAFVWPHPRIERDIYPQLLIEPVKAYDIRSCSRFNKVESMTAQTMLQRVDWFQTISMLAILVGVFLVAYEVRQTRALDLAQLASEGYSLIAHRRLTLLGDEPLDALMKSCF